MEISRRYFLKTALLAVGTVLFSPFRRLLFGKKAPGSGEKGFIVKKEALFWESLDDETIRCNLCPQRCTLKNGVRGWCKAREPQNGKHYSLVYGNPASIHIDPIEKKPFFHFLPGTGAFSIATSGCNYRCKNCQNWQISQFPPDETINWYLPPEEVSKQAVEAGCASIAYTYSEPLIFFEYTLDSSKLARQKKVRNVVKTNGSINPEPMAMILDYLDGANVDLKFIDPKIHYEVTRGNLKSVLDNLVLIKKRNVWLEITNLLIPTLSDGEDHIRKLSLWVKTNLGTEVPLHFSRFSPHHLLKNLPPTAVSVLTKARQIALAEGLKYVYVGNLPGNDGEHTYCPKCGKIAIKRIGYRILENNLKNGACSFCKAAVPGVWK